ncbi:MAG TPA: TIGR02453 family protein [Bacteroidales bacterium]|nr:MAG: hypothetical protein A2W98_08715 [Bacteroidetes bacterium GWF2_33_38]OFY75879.1 MAG: hypothetical protein A2265_00175 [Bacteroidetes bacterium RIFOXYA12_FULL_33_9]OFY88352.1 MAG: hypothetical protein A2236_02210 [Bacteroidetes bacterium RIFOXYA2_FULL_33_7]HBF87405.1 TIGR02453 family protein [Bacteroidales bacterium]
MINKDTLNFLKNLKCNNNKDWFAIHKEEYSKALSDFENTVKLLIEEIQKFDSRIVNIEAKDCIFRIYRDVRFAKDKTPYKPNFGAYIADNGRKSTSAGYYIHLEDENSFLAGGIYMPESNKLKAIRDEIYFNVTSIKIIIQEPYFVEYFGEIVGEKLQRVPKEYPKEYPDADLLKFKSYTMVHKVDNDFFVSNNSLKNAIMVFKAMKPFNDFLNSAEL